MADRDGMFTRREYLLLAALTLGKEKGLLNVFAATEAVDSVALGHPEWDMDELKTFADWEAYRRLEAQR